MFFVFCPVLHNYCNNYFETMSKIFNTKVDVCPTTAIFRVHKAWTRFTSKQLDVLALTCLLYWLDDKFYFFGSPPTHQVSHSGLWILCTFWSWKRLDALSMPVMVLLMTNGNLLSHFHSNFACWLNLFECLNHHLSSVVFLLFSL